MVDPDDTRTLQLQLVPPLRTLMPATLAGRCANGYERDRGAVVHAVPCSEREQQFGINAYARALCGKTHGARSAGWSSRPGAALTCPTCARRASEDALG